MMESSPRTKAVIDTMNKIQEIFRDRDSFERSREILAKYRPEVVYEQIESDQVPKWSLNLFLTLTELYDAGYEDAWKDREKLK